MEKYTKKEAIRQIRDICSGISGHDFLALKKANGRGYVGYTTMGVTCTDAYRGYMTWSHDRNDMTLAEAAKELSSAMLSF